MSRVRLFCPGCGQATADPAGVQWLAPDDGERREYAAMQCVCGCRYLVDPATVIERVRAARAAFDAMDRAAGHGTARHVFPDAVT